MNTSKDFQLAFSLADAISAGTYMTESQGLLMRIFVGVEDQKNYSHPQAP